MKPRKTAVQARGAVRRCAIYTRKSSEEGLEQAFNSLDAQREACDAYIRSQRHEGWVALPTLYDDGGISGGTMDRPSLRQLLADIAAGKVHLVVVYKVDRLTRSLSDFAKIVDVFDANQASFVSVTQQFNTTTSMGRLTLNMLLSFAQFEREVTGERIRDKIAASKRKGMWMGGTVPLGYDVQDRRLVINQADVVLVRRIFSLYLELGSVRLLKERLAAEGARSKMRPHATGSRARGGRALERGALYKVLQNPVYRGEVHHQGNIYQGEHEAIIDLATWEAVQAKLSENRNEHVAGKRATNPSLLAGLVFDQYGERLIPTHANKSGRRYRYYVSKKLLTEGTKASADGLRLPAVDLERIVTDRLLQFLGDPTEVLRAIRASVHDGNSQRLMLERAAQTYASWSERSASERRNLLQQLIAHIEVQPHHLHLHLNVSRLAALLLGKPDPGTSNDNRAEALVLALSMTMVRSKHEMRLIIKGQTQAPKPDPTLVRLIVKAQGLWKKLLQGNMQQGELAAQNGLSSSYFTRLARHALLAPDITAAILDGRQPASLTASKLMLDSRLPLDWAEQRRVLGFG